jgi:uncharacterized protein (DUF433 family)
MILMPGFSRITFDPNVMGGRDCIRGMRVTVSLVVNLVANGMSIEEILEAYPYLDGDDIRQTLQYAAWLAEETVQLTSPLKGEEYKQRSFAAGIYFRSKRYF